MLALSFAACNNGSSLASNEGNLPPPDSTPQDTLPPPPPDTTPPQPPVDTTTPPPSDTTAPPPAGYCAGFSGPSGPDPTHQGIAMGPTHVPTSRFGPAFSGTQITALTSTCLLADLDAARRANVRVFISFTGNEQYNRDANGFSFTKWKQRVDRFRNLNLTPYINDGTILGHLIMDEPNDKGNWNGKVVTQAEIEAMAAYSKEVWPTMTTYLRTFPDFLKGGQYPHLDALWFHYLERFGPIDEFIDKHFPVVRSLGLKIIAGLNVINGGGKDSGIPGKGEGKNAMSADEIREWGGKLMAQPDLCAFLLWEYDDSYFDRPDIKAAVEDLANKARAFPTRDCSR
jgi:hypothetical protein